MPSVDDRIVRIEFDNSSFERKIDATLHSLAQLDKALQLEGAAAGLENVDKAAKGINLSSIAEGVDHIASRFTALGAVGFSVIENLTKGIMGFGAQIARKVGTDVLEPIITGGRQRALNIEQAKFLFAGLGADVDKSMASAKEAVLGTAYGLDEAAKTAAQFGASGIDAGKDMTGALKGVAGVAAMTNSSFSEIADIFTQAAGAGKISGYTLERISYRGLNVAAAMAKQMGKSEAQIRDMASKGQIDFKTFAKAMDQAFGAHAQEANKTYSGSLANLHAAMSRLGAVVMTPQLERQRDLFNAITPQVDKLTKALTPLLDTFSALARLSINNLIKMIGKLDFSNLQKAAPIISKGFTNIFIMLNKIKTIAGQAFRDIFPKSTTSVILQISNAFLKFTQSLRIAGGEGDKLRHIFRGFFAVLSIGWTVIKEGVKFLATLVRMLTGLGGPKLQSGLIKIADFFTDLQKGLVKGKGIHDFFTNLAKAIQAPVKHIGDLIRSVGQLFGIFKSAGAATADKSLGRVGDRVKSLEGPFKGLIKLVQGVWDVLKKVGSALGNFFGDLAGKLGDAFSSGNYNKVLDTFNTVFLGGLVASLAYFFKHGLKIDLTGGIGAQIKGIFTELSKTLQAFQTQIKAKALKDIAIALAILTASIIALSLIDSASLTKSLAAMTVGFTELMGAFAILNKMNVGMKSTAQFAMLSAGLIIFAGAVLILSFAASKLAKLDWNGLAKGLTGITVMLGALIGSVQLMKNMKMETSLVKIGLGLIAMSIGLDIMASAVKKMGGLSWEQMAKGFLGLGVGLAGIAGAAKLMNVSDMVKIGTGLLILSGGLYILALAIKAMGKLDWATMGKGMIGLGVALVGIAGAMHLMPPNMMATSAALLLVSVALLAIGKAMQMMGGMSWGEIAKGMVAIGGALLILAIGANAMQTAIAGAAAIAIMSGSMVLMAFALQMLAKVPIAGLVTGLIAIAGAILVFAGMAVLLSEAIPSMLGIGIAMMALGAGLMFMGAAALMGALAIEALSRAAKDGAENITKALEAIGKGIPALFKGFAEGIIELVVILGKGAGQIADAFGKIFDKMLDQAIKFIPKILKIIDEVITGIIKLIREKIPQLVDTGVALILAWLDGMRQEIGGIVDIVLQLVIDLLDTFSQKIPEIVNSLVNMITQILTSVAEGVGKLAATLWIGLGASFIKGFMEGLNQYLPGLTDWFTSLAGNILTWIGDVSRTLFGKGWDFISGLFSGIVKKAVDVTRWFSTLASNVLRWIGNVAGTLIGKGWDFISGLLSGITRAASNVISWFGRLAGSVLSWIGNTASTLFGKGMDFISGLLSGLSSAFGQVTGWVSGIGDRIKGAIGNVGSILSDAGSSVISGLISGFNSAWGKVTSWIHDQIDKIPAIVRKVLHIDSPSKVFREIGINIIQGLEVGLDQAKDGPVDMLANVAQQMSETMDGISGSEVVITPVLDLTRVQDDASKIQDIFSANPVNPAFSTAQASKIAADTNAQKTATSPNATDTPAGVTFTQIINAPEQLSTADIYKQTRNQITLAKEELSIP